MVQGLKIPELDQEKQITLERVQDFARYRRPRVVSLNSLSDAIAWKCIHWSVASVYRSLTVS